MFTTAATIASLTAPGAALCVLSVVACVAMGVVALASEAALAWTGWRAWDAETLLEADARETEAALAIVVRLTVPVRPLTAARCARVDARLASERAAAVMARIAGPALLAA